MLGVDEPRTLNKEVLNVTHSLIIFDSKETERISILSLRLSFETKQAISVSASFGVNDGADGREG